MIDQEKVTITIPIKRGLKAHMGIGVNERTIVTITIPIKRGLKVFSNLLIGVHFALLQLLSRLKGD